MYPTSCEAISASSNSRNQAFWFVDGTRDELLRAWGGGDSGGFAEDLAAISGLGLPMRVVLDMARLPEELLATAVEASIDAGAAGVQSGNGFGSPCRAADIAVVSGLCRGRCAIKAAGGIHHPELALDLLEAGAALLGTSSAPELLQALRRPIA